MPASDGQAPGPSHAAVGPSVNDKDANQLLGATGTQLAGAAGVQLEANAPLVVAKVAAAVSARTASDLVVRLMRFSPRIDDDAYILNLELVTPFLLN